MDNPIPTPRDFVVKNGWKMRSTLFGSIPVPESSSVIITSAGSWRSELARNVRGLSTIKLVAAMAFTTKFKNNLLQLDSIGRDPRDFFGEPVYHCYIVLP